MFDGPEDYHARIDDPALDIDERCVLFMRGTGPIGYPGRCGSREYARAVCSSSRTASISCPASATDVSRGHRHRLRSSNASPEAAIGGGLAVLRNGDRVRVDLNKGRRDTC